MADGLLEKLSKKNQWNSFEGEILKNRKIPYKWIKICDYLKIYPEINKKKPFKGEIYHSSINMKNEKLMDLYYRKIENLIKIQRFCKKIWLKNIFPFYSF